MKKLFIVESQPKIKTIKSFLDTNWTVIATSGHFKFIKKKDNAVEINKDQKISVDYEYEQSKCKLIIEKAKNVEEIYIGSDEDREGELIARNIYEVLVDNQLNIDKKIYRITYNEITKNSILNAIENKHKINNDLADSSLARSIIDFLYGFKVSPILWKQVPFAISSGRVQSCSLNLIVQKEFEILNNLIQEYYTIRGNCNLYDLYSIKFSDNIENKFQSIEEAEKKYDLNEINDNIKNNKFILKYKNSSEGMDTRLKTTTLQRHCNSLFGWSSKKTMDIAQRLYEGIEINKKTVGLITYLRTDSLNFSETFISSAVSYIKNNIGDEHLNKNLRYTPKMKGAQESHEAIRPTDLNIKPENLVFNTDEYKLYKLIWEKSLIYFLKNTEYTTEFLEIKSKNNIFIFSNKYVTYKGQLYFSENVNLNKDVFANINSLELFVDLTKTKQKPRYTEGSLIKELESNGIGRPSTYATIIDTIFARGYIKKKNNSIIPTKNGIIKNSFMIKNFHKYIDVNFTKWMEQKLDEISLGKYDYKKLIIEFANELYQNINSIYGIAFDQIEELKKYLNSLITVKFEINGLLFHNSYYIYIKNSKIVGFINEIETLEEDSDEIKQLKCLSPFIYQKKPVGVLNKELRTMIYGLKSTVFKSSIDSDDIC